MSQAPNITGVEGERLDATVTVDSTFSSQETQTIELRIEDGGTVVHTDSQSVTLADSTDSQQITLSWPTSAGDAGVYDLFLESDEDTIQRLVEVLDRNAAVLADNHWRFDEGGGSVAADSAGSFGADFGSAISWGSGEGKGGTYGILDGTGGAGLGSASKSHWSHWVNSGEGAIGAWIEPDFATQPDQRAAIIATRVEGSTNNNTFSFQYEDNNNLEFEFQTSGNTTTEANASVVQDQTWQAVAVRADGSTVRLYHATVNASSLTQVASASIAATASGDLSQAVNIGRNDPAGTGDRYAAGGIDDLWSDQSDPGEQAIKDWYNATKGNYS